MRKIVLTLVCAAYAAFSAEMPRSEWHAKVGDCAQDPALLKQTISQLSAADQTAFLADVNAAIAKMPGSTDEKTAKYLDVDAAALKGAKEGNLPALIAEVFATVPPNSLTVINERFAADLFNRKADPSKTYTDEQYVDIATKLMEKVQDRTATADNAGVRDTFAILMLIRASNGTPADLRDTLVDSLRDPTTKDLAQNEWISPALGIGQEKTYDPMLGASAAGDQPNLNIEIQVPVTIALDALASDLASVGSMGDESTKFTPHLPSLFEDPTLALGAGQSKVASDGSGKPRTMDPNSPYNPKYKRGGSGSKVIPQKRGVVPRRRNVVPVIPPNGPYDGQTTN